MQSPHAVRHGDVYLEDIAGALLQHTPTGISGDIGDDRSLVVLLEEGPALTLLVGGGQRHRLQFAAVVFDALVVIVRQWLTSKFSLRHIK